MRLLFILAIGAALAAAQDTPAPKPAEAKPVETPPAPAAEEPMTGSVDLGYRWITPVGGNFNVYRSVVNLGEGPKLLGANLTFRQAPAHLFDRLDIRGAGWGGDPYTTARLDAVKQGAYRLSFDYRNLAFFNFLPSFANPQLGQGILLDQRSYDTRRRFADVQLDLKPGSRISPYLAYNHDSGSGSGITDFVSDANEYPVSNRISDSTESYRGGVRVELQRLHLTIEQGGTTFKDDQRAFTSDRNLGNRGAPLLGQQLFLTNLLQAYRIRGDSVYSKALVAANPSTWLDVYGQFLYSQPQTDVRYTENATGNFVDLSSLLFFTSRQSLFTAMAKQPHTTASAGAELRPMSRLRIVETWVTDRMHGATSGDRWLYNYNQQTVEALVDLAAGLTVRGGYRYEWGSAAGGGPLISVVDRETGELRRHAGLAGLAYRAGGRLRLNFDFEGASGDRNYFRTSLKDYEKYRLHAHYQAASSLSLAVAASLLDNRNPDPSVRYDYLYREASFSAFWSPGAGKRISVLGEYTRSGLHSQLTYLVPQTLTRELSVYRDNAHTGSGLVEIIAPGGPKISLGGAWFSSAGSRAASYYQPLVRFAVPIGKHLQWMSEWRWYGFTEESYRYENFRTNQFVLALRLIR